MSKFDVNILKDDNEYYNGVGKQFLSNSDISSLLTNPREFGVSREDNKNFAIGRYFHQCFLEPEKASKTLMIDVSTRNTKAYKEAVAESGNDFILLSSEVAEVDELVHIMKSNIHFFEEIYDEAAEYEVPAVGEIFGVQWKGKADIVKPDKLIDLKTTSDIQSFRYSARKYNYDSQCYIYQKLFGKPLVFYVIDKSTKMLGVFAPTEEFLQRGEEKVRRAVEVYNKFFTPNAPEDINEFYVYETLD